MQSRQFLLSSSSNVAESMPKILREIMLESMLEIMLERTFYSLYFFLTCPRVGGPMVEVEWGWRIQYKLLV